VFLTGPLSRVSSTALRAKAKAKARRRNEVVAKRAQAPAALPWRKPNAGQLAPEPEDVRQPGRVPEAQSAQGS
jgi:hypothetical protein